MSPTPWLLGAAAVSCALLIAGPVSAWTRRYVREPFHDGDASDTEAERTDYASSSSPDTSNSSSSAKRAEYPALTHPGFLNSAPQGALSLALSFFCVWWGSITGASMPALVAVPVYALLGCAASVDGVAHLLPNRLLGATTTWLAMCGIIAVTLDLTRAHSALTAVLCSLSAGGISLLLALFRSGLGLGDVKLCAVIGLWLGWYSPRMLTLGLCIGVSLGGLAALLLLVTRRVSRKDPMAYGPYLIAGALLIWPLTIA